LTYICKIKRIQKNSFYLHEVEIKKKLQDVFKTRTESGTSKGASKLIIAKKLQEVKSKNIFNIDENGEPIPEKVKEFEKEIFGYA